MRILFISHETTRTGANIVLFYLMQWLKNQETTFEISLLALKRGGFEKELKTVADNYMELDALISPPPIFKERLKKRIYNNLGIALSKTDPKNSLLKNLAHQEFDVIYANTVVSVPTACKIKSFNDKLKVIVHVHELETVIRLRLPNFMEYAKKIDSFIAASDLVKQSLIRNFLIPSEKIEMIYEFVKPLKEIPHKEEKKFTIGGVGTNDWRKGNDLFIQVANYLKIRHPNLKMNFIWVGFMDIHQELVIKEDLRKAGLERVVSFVGEKENPFNFYTDFDVFLLPSREDPFPLVAIEMAMLGKPIICFEGATGTAEILKKGGGKIVPYLDVPGMAEEVRFYYENRDKMLEDGAEAKQLFSSFIPENICPRILGKLRQLSK